MAEETKRKRPTRRQRSKHYKRLCLIVLIGWLGVNAGILALGRTPLWRTDALPLYVNFLAWEGQALRDTIVSLVTGYGFTFPMYTYSLGYGVDSLVTMMGCLNDPFNLISVFFPPELAEIPYVVMIPVRLMLAAVTFSWYCFERGHGRGETLVASLCYTFSGYAIFWGVLRHANFINWPILLPVILLGADRIFEGKKPTAFIWGIGLLFFCSVYFTYMSCLALLVYCLIKYFFAPRERSAADFAKLVGRFVGFLLIGFAIGAVFAFPSIIALLSQGRATDGAIVPLLFPLSYYAAVGVQSVGGMVTTRGLYIGAVPIVLGAVFVLCGKYFPKEEHRPWLIGLVLCWIGIFVPYIGHVFNGFGYVSDRWMIIYNFVCAYVVCMTIPVVAKLAKSDLNRVLIGVVVIALWAALYVAYPVVVTSKPMQALWPLGMVLALLIVYAVVRHQGKRLVGLLACAVILGVSVNALGDLSPLGTSYARHFPLFGVAGQDITSASPAAVIDKIDDDSLFRQTYGRVYGGRKNAALTHGTMGVDYYSSYYNQKVDDYRQELGLCDHYLNYSYVGNDSRLALEAISGVKYYIANDEDTWRAPYGFTEFDQITAGPTTYHVYESSHRMPLGFLSDRVIPRSTYDTLSMVDKQSALLDGIVVDDSKLEKTYATAEFAPTAAPADYTIESTDGLTIDGNIIVTTKGNASMTLSFEGQPYSETYVVFEDLAFSGHSPIHSAELNGKAVTLKTRVQELLWNKPTTFIIDCSIGDNHKSFEAATPEMRSYGGKDNWVVNMGYSDDARTNVQIQFNKAGTYTFDELGIYCQPVDPIVSRIDSLSTNNLEYLKLEANRIEAKVTLDDDASKLAFFSFAHTPGWSAKVDAKDAPVLQADTAFMAVELSGKGSHWIVLTYMTPGLKEGAIASVLGIVAFIIVLNVGNLIRRRAKRRAANETSEASEANETSEVSEAVGASEVSS